MSHRGASRVACDTSCEPKPQEMECESEEWSECSSDAGFKAKLGGMKDMMSDSSCESSEEEQDAYVCDEIPQQQQPIGSSIPQPSKSKVAVVRPAAVKTAQKVEAVPMKHKKSVKTAMNAVESKLRKTHEENRVTRTFRVEKYLSLTELAQNPSLSSWNLNKEAHHFLRKEKKFYDKTGIKAETKLVGDPKKAVLVSARVKKVLNNLPVAIGITSNQIPSNTVTSDGKALLFTIESGESKGYATGYGVYDSTAALEDKFMKRFGHLTKEDVTKDITDFMNTGKCLVPNDSPIIDIIKSNPNQFEGMDKAYFNDQESGVSGYKLDKKSVDRIANRLISMLNELPHTDMTELTFSICRTDGEHWDSTNNVETFSNTSEQLNRAMNKEQKVVFEIEMTHILTNTNN